MRAHGWISWIRALDVGLDVLVAGLAVLAVVEAAGRPAVEFVTAIAVAAVLLVVYGAGRTLIRVRERSVTSPRGAWWPDAAWIVSLIVLWCVLLLVSPGALWLSFPLFLLQMHVLGPHRGLVAVVVTTALVVVDGIVVEAPTGAVPLGFVLGPVLGAAVAIAVVLGLEALVRESEERQATVDELVAARELLADAERERLVRDERERLAREIHDTLAQGFSAIELLLRAARAARPRSDDPTVDHIEQARELARHNLDEARRFVRDLAPLDLDDVALVAALHRVAERHRAPGLAVTLRTEGTPRPLPIAIESALLRIAQSALANVDQHADASEVEIVVDFTPDAVALDVVDDGVGFDPAAPSGSRRLGGFGIAAMRARAGELGGSVAFATAPGEGTALTVTIPVLTRAPAPSTPSVERECSRSC